MSTSTSCARIGSFLSPYIVFLVRNAALLPNFRGCMTVCEVNVTLLVIIS